MVKYEWLYIINGVHALWASRMSDALAQCATLRGVKPVYAVRTSVRQEIVP